MKKTRNIVIMLIGGFLFIGIIAGNHAFADEGWSDSMVVSSESGDFAYRAVLAADENGVVHIAWNDKTDYAGAGSDWDVFYKMKASNGSWTASEVVSVDNMTCNCVFMGVDQAGVVHVVWSDQTGNNETGGIFYRQKTAEGTWLPVEHVSPEGNGDYGCPSLTVDKSGAIYVTWTDRANISGSGSDLDVFYAKREEGSWSSVELVSVNSHNDTWKPSLVVDSTGIIHSVWYEKQGDFYEIVYSKKPVGGNWSTAEVVSNESSRNAMNPSFLRVDSNDTLHVAWEDNTDYDDAGLDYDIFYKRKPQDKGWSRIEVISSESDISSSWPSLAIDKNNTVYVAWKDKISYEGSDADYDVFYKRKISDVEWSGIELVSVNSMGDSSFSSIVADPLGWVHVSWWDETPDGKWVVLYNSKAADKADPLFTDSTNDSEETPGFAVVVFIAAVIFTFVLRKKMVVR